MTIIEAAKLALDAMQDAAFDEEGYIMDPDLAEAHDDLRTAIEQAEKPVAWVNRGENIIERVAGWDGYGALYTTPPAPVEEASAQFEKWWEDQGQFCRAGGGEYEKTFAFRAWEAALATPPAAPVQKGN
jgi:hypothetical protein